MSETDEIDSNAVFHILIEQPLQAVLNQRLRKIGYWLLSFEERDFCLETPNRSGLYAVRMEFENRILELFPAWDNWLRGTNAYHIQARLVPQDRESDAFRYVKSLTVVEAKETALWSNALAQPLTSVEVYGIGQSPQAICLAFSSEKVVVSIGYSGEKPLVGDGDEILVFSYEQWRSQEKTLSNPWTDIGATRRGKNSPVV